MVEVSRYFISCCQQSSPVTVHGIQMNYVISIRERFVKHLGMRQNPLWNY